MNIYDHVTDDMQRSAAAKIDREIGKATPTTSESPLPRKPAPSTFHATGGQQRKSGTGCVSQINDTLWEGRYSPIRPDGKRHARNVYAHDLDVCEHLLAEKI